MPGFQEILILVGIVLVIFFLPRITRRTKETMNIKSDITLVHWKIRLLIVFSLAWLAFTALYFKVWQLNFIEFTKFGILPTLGVWGIWWIIRGFGKKS